MRRSTLATRIALLSVGIAVVTAVVAGLLAIGLIRGAAQAPARASLARLADVAQSVPGNGAGIGRPRLRRALRGLHVRSGVIRPTGRVVTASRLVRRAVTGSDVSRILGGGQVSAVRSVGATPVFVEARSTGRGGVVVVQRQVDATAQDQRAIGRIFVAVLIAGALAAVIGLLVAWRLSRPLRRTAAAAHSLGAGNRDITLPAHGPAEIVEVSEAINTLAAGLRFSERRQREFLLSVSHDLRTPLTAIAGYAESLAEGVIAPQDTAHVGGVVLGEANRLERLVGDLLDLARLGAQDFRVEPTSVDLVALVHAAAGVWAARCAASGVEFGLDAPRGPLVTMTDAARLRQVLDGLFDNALRVTPAGARIVLAARAEPGSAVVEVRDGGPGLREEDLAVAFDQGVLHQRYRGVRQVGTGLGLAIVRGLVQRLGGGIQAGHADEGGARFTVRLPLPPPTP